MSFSNLQLIEPVLRALSHEGYTKPTPIQEKSIPAILEKKDFLGCAQTGTGKTAAFVIPLLQILHQQHALNQIRQTSTLILTPTRELAIQIGESIVAYGRFLNLKHQVIFGGVPQHGQVQAIRKGVDIIVATPGRLIDLINQGHISLRQIRYFVLDEADRMLDMGFVQDVKKIIAWLPMEKQTLFFSATMPEQIQQLARQLLKDPVKVHVSPISSTAELIEQSVCFTEKQHKLSLLIDLLKDDSLESVLVFTQMKHSADKLARNLNKAGLRTEAIHGNRSQSQRQQALRHFKEKKIRVLVATDIAARGIDIDGLTHVINYELPNVPETYVHRIGRTGRAGSAGIAISFCDWSEKIFLTDIQKLIRKQIPVLSGHTYDVPSMHQGITQAKAVSPSFNGRRNPGLKRRNARTFSQRA